MRRAGFWLVLIVFGGPLLYALVATLWALTSLSDGQVDATGDTEVLLISGPIHYDFLLPLNEATLDRFSELETHGLPLKHPNARWLLVGWGARDFYTTTGSYSDVSLRAVLRGVFGDKAVIRTDVLGELHPDANPLHFVMNAAQYNQLLHAMNNTIERRSDGSLAVLDTPGFTDTDRFFAAKGNFNLFATCNTWVGQMIRKAGLPFGAWVPLPFAVTLSHRVFLREARTN
jgi:uncharacterized protein (TIGR02117 family)